MAEINEFISLVRTEGLARSNRFIVYIYPPFSMTSQSFDTKLSFYCESVSLPGMNLLTNPVTTYGEQREVVYNRSYEPVNLEFMLDQNMDIKRYFDDWQNKIIHPVSRMVNYYQNYIGTIEIYQLGSEGNEQTKYAVRLHEAYPKSIAPISYNYDAKGISKLSVSIEYKYWVPLAPQKSIGGDEQQVADYEEGGPGIGSGNQFASALGGQTALDIPSQGGDEIPT